MSESPRRRGDRGAHERRPGDVRGVPRSGSTEEPLGAALGHRRLQDGLDRRRRRRNSWPSVPLLIVQDLFPSPLWERATYQLPGAAFAERAVRTSTAPIDCSPSTGPSARPRALRSRDSCTGDCWAATGLYQARAVLDEVAREIAYFAAAAGPLPAVGVDLKVNQLANTR